MLRGLGGVVFVQEFIPRGGDRKAVVCDERAFDCTCSLSMAPCNTEVSGIEQEISGIG